MLSMDNLSSYTARKKGGCIKKIYAVARVLIFARFSSDARQVFVSELIRRLCEPCTVLPEIS